MKSYLFNQFKKAYLLTSMFLIASTLMPSLVSAGCNTNTFLGIKPWNQYLTYEEKDGNCDLSGPKNNEGGIDMGQVVILVALALVDILLRLAGTVAFVLIVYSGFKFVLSQGNPEKEKQARDAVVNALIGLVISIIAVAAVTFIGNQLKK